MFLKGRLMPIENTSSVRTRHFLKMWSIRCEVYPKKEVRNGKMRLDSTKDDVDFLASKKKI